MNKIETFIEVVRYNYNQPEDVPSIERAIILFNGTVFKNKVFSTAEQGEISDIFEFFEVTREEQAELTSIALEGKESGLKFDDKNTVYNVFVHNKDGVVIYFTEGGVTGTPFARLVEILDM